MSLSLASPFLNDKRLASLNFTVHVARTGVPFGRNIVYFVLTGEPPFGSGDAKTILARQLSAVVDLDRFPPEIAEWLKQGLSADPDERFPDAAEMQAAWRRAALAERERKFSWWRHWLVGDSR